MACVLGSSDVLLVPVNVVGEDVRHLSGPVKLSVQVYLFLITL